MGSGDDIIILNGDHNDGNTDVYGDDEDDAGNELMFSA